MKTPAILLMLTLLCACAAEEKSTPLSPDQLFLDQSFDYLNGLFEFRTVYATALGVHIYDGDLPDYSPRSVEAERQRIEEHLQLLSTLPAGHLSVTNLSDLEYLRASMAAWRSALTHRPTFRRDPLFYNQLIVDGLELLLRRNYAPASERMKSLVSRLAQIPDFLEVAQVNLTEMPEILRQASENPIVNTMYMLRDDLEERIRNQLSGDLPEGFEEAHIQAIYAYTDFILFVKDPVRSRSIEDVSIGEDLFLARWMSEEFVNVSVESILELCGSARERLLIRMEEGARLMDPAVELPDLLSRIEDEHATVKGVTDTLAQAADELKAFTREKELVDFAAGSGDQLKIMNPDPRTLDRISLLPQELRGTRYPVAYVSLNPVPPGSDDEARQGHLRCYTPFSIAIMAAGISYPGTFVQTGRTRDKGNILHQVLQSSTFTEGWAHYCEALVIEQGFDPRPEALLTQLKMSLLEINCLEVSTRLHCQGMSLDEAVLFLAEHSFIHPAMARSEVVRIIRNPKSGAGFIGKAQILKLRDLYQAEMTGRTLKQFHHVFLSLGQAPIPVIANLAFGKQI